MKPLHLDMKRLRVRSEEAVVTPVSGQRCQEGTLSSLHTGRKKSSGNLTHAATSRQHTLPRVYPSVGGLGGGGLGAESAPETQKV